MNQIEELDRTLPGRLRTSAAALTPGPDALSAVRARAAGRRRRSRTAVLIGSAAAVVAIAVGVGIVSGGEPPSGVVAGPASGPDESTASAPVADADATLLIFRYPNATREMIDADPKMGGEWAQLSTATQTCLSLGPVEQLGLESPCEVTSTGELLAMVDAFDPMQALGRRNPTEATVDLMLLLTTGVATAEQVSHITAQLQALPGVTLSSPDNGATVTVDWQDANGDTTSITLDASTGHPIRRSWSVDPRIDVEYVSVTRVRAADHLVPGRGIPMDEFATTTTTEPNAEEQPR